MFHPPPNQDYEINDTAHFEYFLFACQTRDALASQRQRQGTGIVPLTAQITRIAGDDNVRGTGGDYGSPCHVPSKIISSTGSRLLQPFTSSSGVW